MRPAGLGLHKARSFTTIYPPVPRTAVPRGGASGDGRAGAGADNKPWRAAGSVNLGGGNRTAGRLKRPRLSDHTGRSHRDTAVRSRERLAIGVD